MFRTGIWRAAALKELETSRRFRPVSYRLLKDVTPENPDSIQVFEHIVRWLRLSSGIWRTTYPERFADVDREMSRLLPQIFGTRPIEIHDWAASDCLASAEWAEKLAVDVPAARLVASDLLLHLVEVSRGSEAFITEPDGTPLQYVRPPFVVSLQEPAPLFYPVNRLLAALARSRSVQIRDMLQLCRWPDSPTKPVSLAAWTAERISLIHPRARQRVAAGSGFEIRTHSVFTPLTSPCQVIRTMNIFNRKYFGEPMLREGARCVHESLEEGGIWVIGRTVEEKRPTRNCASIFQKADGAFRLLFQLNGGSEIDPVVAAGFGPIPSHA